ncbi:hypothetical protein MTBLM1_10314 [Rhodospirillaceae bacterium LM-1]|nr:hypothetical protein MTBLM1_10314 [Rhodospirillaceae bacterium LM-1]
MELTFSARFLRRDSADGRGSRDAAENSNYIRRGRLEAAHEYDFREGKHADKIDELTGFGLVFPENLNAELAENWRKNPADMWRHVDSEEDRILDHRFRRDPYRAAAERSTASPAHRIILSVHNDLTPDDAFELAQKFCSERLAKFGMAAEFAVHSKPGNLHVHILHSTREIEKNGECSRSKSAPFKDRADLKNWMLDSKRYVADWQNERLQERGIQDTVEWLSFKERGLEKAPTLHRGPAQNALEIKSGKTREQAISKDFPGPDFEKSRRQKIELSAKLDEAKKRHQQRREDIDSDRKQASLLTKVFGGNALTKIMMAVEIESGKAHFRHRVRLERQRYQNERQQILESSELVAFARKKQQEREIYEAAKIANPELAKDAENLKMKNREIAGLMRERGQQKLKFDDPRNVEISRKSRGRDKLAREIQSVDGFEKSGIFDDVQKSKILEQSRKHEARERVNQYSSLVSRCRETWNQIREGKIEKNSQEYIEWGAKKAARDKLAREISADMAAHRPFFGEARVNEKMIQDMVGGQGRPEHAPQALHQPSREAREKMKQRQIERTDLAPQAPALMAGQRRRPAKRQHDQGFDLDFDLG